MSDTPSAAPAAPASTPVQAATQQVMGTLPPDQKPPKKVEASAASSDEVEDSGEDIAAEEAKKIEAAAKKAYKLKVNGKDMEVDEAELLKRAQMGYSADKKWQEAAQIQKQTQDFIALMQRDPAKALEMMGYDVDKLAEERIKSRIEEMQKSPEQLEREKMQRELEDMKAERERERAETQARETQQLQDKYAMEIENDISSALDDNGLGLPKSPYVVKRVADLMLYYVSEGLRTNNERLKNVTAKDVLPLISDEIQNEQRELYSLTPDDVFERLVGKDRLNKYRKAKIKKTAKPASVSDIKPTGAKELQKAQEESDRNKKKTSAKDFFRTLGSGKV
jgi:hypothetical protein